MSGGYVDLVGKDNLMGEKGGGVTNVSSLELYRIYSLRLLIITTLQLVSYNLSIIHLLLGQRTIVWK